MAHLSPGLADQGRYRAAEATATACCASPTHSYAVAGPRPRLASGPNQVWIWDITYLRTTVRGTFFCLYLIMDLYRREGGRANALVLHADTGA